MRRSFRVAAPGAVLIDSSTIELADPAGPREAQDRDAGEEEACEGAERGRHDPEHRAGGMHQRVAGDAEDRAAPRGTISAKGRHVVVIGGGDTGSDCIGTSIRQGAVSVTNFEIMPQPPEHENKPLTWPLWPLKLRTSSSHEEGAERDFAVGTVKSRANRGRRKLAELLHMENGEDLDMTDQATLAVMASSHTIAR